MAAFPRPNRLGVVFVAGLLALALGVAFWPRTAAGQPGEAPPGALAGAAIHDPAIVGCMTPGMGCMSPASTPPSGPKDMTVEQLITALADLKARKAELEKQEKELSDAVKAKLKEHKNRLHQLGVPLDEDVTPAPVAAPLTSCLPCTPVSSGRH
jgi:hypothetical protein